MKRLPARLLLVLLAAYQRWVSPALPRRCRYEPTCSAYAAQAIRELGALRGSIVAAWRVFRCNPFSDGGIDDLADRRLFREAPVALLGQTRDDESGSKQPLESRSPSVRDRRVEAAR